MSELQRWNVSEPWINLHCSLGEGPYYEPATNSLRFVDIKKKQLHTVSLTEGPESVTTQDFDIPLGVTADIEGVDPKEKLLVAGKSGVYVLERKTGKLELLKRFWDGEAPEGDKKMRANDGAVDPQGRFWVGTMNDFWVGECNPVGNLYRFHGDLARHDVLPSLRIPNGLGWSLDEKTMYFTHSTERHILAFDYDAPTGNLANKRVFWKYDGAGEPDGFKMDTDGYIWQAIYNDGKVVRISPEGKIVGEITYPTKCITCPVFVGTELWVTTANDGDEKYGGAIFKVDVGISGKKESKFKLDESVNV